MIHVVPAPEPATFHADVRKPGLAFLKRRRSAKTPFKPPWTKVLDDLMAAYQEVCAYSCFRIHPVTGGRSADHLAPKSVDEQQVYEWSNYRLCCARLSSRKRHFGDVLDPFLVKTGWFQLELVGFQALPDPQLSQALRNQVQATIDRLALNDFRRRRASDAEDYWGKGISLQVLRRESPFVAEELRRQNRLNPGDAW